MSAIFSLVIRSRDAQTAHPWVPADPDFWLAASAQLNLFDNEAILKQMVYGAGRLVHGAGYLVLVHIGTEGHALLLNSGCCRHCCFPCCLLLVLNVV